MNALSLKQMESYDNEKLQVNRFLKILLLLGYSVLLETCPAILHNDLHHLLYSEEIKILKYYMKTNFLKLGASVFYTNNGAPFLNKRLCRITLETSSRQEYPEM